MGFCNILTRKKQKKIKASDCLEERGEYLQLFSGGWGLCSPYIVLHYLNYNTKY